MTFWLTKLVRNMLCKLGAQCLSQNGILHFTKSNLEVPSPGFGCLIFVLWKLTICSVLAYISSTDKSKEKKIKEMEK